MKFSQHLYYKNKKFITQLILLTCAYTCITLSYACSDLVEVGSPSISTDQGNVYTSNTKAIGVINGLYAKMSVESVVSGQSLNSFMSFFPGLSSDEFMYFPAVRNSGQLAYYQNTLTNAISPDFWSIIYKKIFNINSAIEGLSNSTTLSDKVKQHLLAEAKFLRAIHYFYLVNLYGDIPLTTGTDYKINLLLARSPTDLVYNQIITDLKEAEIELSDFYPAADRISNSTERIYPTKWAAKTLLARVYLYKKDYADAITYSTDVIKNNSLFLMTDLDNTFLKNNNEAIWQLQPVNSNWNTEDARFFVLPDNGPNNDHPVYLSTYLLNSFANGDLRRTKWVDSVTVDSVIFYFPNKYKSAKMGAPVTEYHTVLRLAELYLIRAEANAQLNKLSDAISDLNVIKNRAGLSDYTGEENISSIIDDIMQERRIEFFSEWGHRWLDLKRYDKVDALMSVITPDKGGVWNSYDKLYPLNINELSLSPNITQTEGY